MTPPRCLWTAWRSVFVAAVTVAAFPQAAVCAVTKLEIRQTLPFAEGRSFAGSGRYQRHIGRVYFAVDPKAAANRQIVDLKHAPTNEQGLVEFSADLEILAPADLNRASGVLLYDVNNRGRRMCLDLFNQGADHFLMRRGVIVVWSGWIAEVLPREDALRLDAPIASTGERPITGMVRAEIMTDTPTTRASVSNRDWVGSYAPAEQGIQVGQLSWRLREKDRRVAVPREQWRLEVQPHGGTEHRHALPKVELVFPAGLRPGYIYELIYKARDPVVQGLGLAGIRDLISLLKHETGEGNPLRGADAKPVARKAIGFGISQSGRCLRVMLHLGFNADEQGRQVFDGMIPHVSGGGLGFFNHRFAAPTRYASQHTNHLFPCDMFPFAYGMQHDPVSGRKDGILRRARAAGVVPKIFHIQNSAEYWHRSGSLVHTDPLGQQDAIIPPEVRIYVVGGAQHGAGDDLPKPRDQGQLPANPTDYRPVLRALFVAMEAWIDDDSTPPPSRHPRISEGTLVGWRQSQSGWRPLPGVRYPEVIQQPELLDYGPQFHAAGLITKHPPQRLKSYRVLVPAYGPDNNELGTLLLPSVAVPLATFTGWNLRDRNLGAQNELLRLVGGYVPFARTAAERDAVGDPRPAVLERYRNFAEYLGHYETAARRLVDERFLLKEDVELLMERARQRRGLFEE